MPLSRDFRGFTSLLLSDNVCWQCRIQLQQRSHSLKIFSLRNGASEERMKAIAPKNGVCTKKAKRFLGTETRPGKFRMRHSKEAAGRLQSRNRARKSKLEDDAWLLPSKGLLSAPGDEAYIISKLAPAIGIPKAKVQVCLQAPGTTNPQIPGSPPLVSNPSRFNPRSFKAHSAKEATWNALSRKHPLRQGSLGICTSKVGRRSYGTASAAMNTDNPTTSENVSNQSELIHLLGNNPTKLDIRQRLQNWQEEHGQSMQDPDTLELIEDRGTAGSMQNTITRPISEFRAFDPFAREQDIEDTDTTNYTEDNVPDTGEDQIFLRQGDLVDIRLQGYSVPGIFLRHVPDQQVQLYTMRGKWMNVEASRIFFSIPEFLPRSMILPLLPHIPDTASTVEDLAKMQSIQVPREVGAPLIDAMLKFSQDSDEEYRKRADQLDNAFEIMTRDVESRYATTTEIAVESLKVSDASKISNEVLYAVHRALLNDDIGFHLDNRNHRVTGLFEIIPQREVALLKQVRAWLRQYQETLVVGIAVPSAMHKKNATTTIESLHPNPFPGFISKVRGIILRSRDHRTLTEAGTIGPWTGPKGKRPPWIQSSELTWVVETGESFTEQESTILKFVDFWAVQRFLQQYSALMSLGPLILRATGMYEGFTLDASTGYTFLQELGVIAPWQNRISSDRRLALPGQNTDITSDRLMSKTIKSIERWKAEDDMKDMRHDWGEMAVFCIDRAGAMEIDDGVSLEEIEEDPTQFWIHVHVANPTSAIPPHHDLAQYAAHLTETVYFPEKLSYMLSPKITQGYFSLANGRPSLTFSAKLNLNGEIMDTKVTPGIVHNVQYLTPQSVGSALTKNSNPSVVPNRITVGASQLPQAVDHRSETLTTSQVAILRKLHQLGKVRRGLREKQGQVAFIQQAEAKVLFDGSGGNNHAAQYANYKSARLWIGDPIISWEYKSWDPILPIKSPDDAEVDMLVPDLMILACEVAAIWCSQRNIPVLYRGTEVNPELPSPSRYKKEVIDESAKKYGHNHFLLISQYLSIVGRSKTMSKPIRHALIGTDAYTKVTSPLRRYGDMIAHWQIEAAIRQEAATGKSLIGSTDTSYLPFSQAKIDKILPRVSGRERLISRSKLMANRHWTLMLLFRAYYFKEAKLPSIFRIFVTESFQKRDMNRGYLQEFGLMALLVENASSRNEGGIILGDWWECKIQEIRAYDRRIIMDPVRLIERMGNIL